MCEQDCLAFVKASLSVLKGLREEVFMARPLLCSDALWRSLDTNMLLGCIRKSCKEDTAYALATQTQIYNHLHSGFIQGHISYTDLDETNIMRSVSLFLELFQIIDELPMIERREPKDKVMLITCWLDCYLSERYCSHPFSPLRRSTFYWNVLWDR
jgi:hypothetical protein